MLGPSVPRPHDSTYLSTPIVNQHLTWPERGWSYCTVATTYMFIMSKLLDGYRTEVPEPSDLNGVYDDFGAGYGTQIAAYIKKYTDLSYVEFQTWSSLAIVDAQLSLGFPVPIGIDHWDGAVFHVLSETAGDGYRRQAPVVGEPHPRDAYEPYPVGHWGIVIGYDRENYYVNDPDSATMVRWDRARFESHNPYIVKVAG